MEPKPPQAEMFLILESLISQNQDKKSEIKLRRIRNILHQTPFGYW